MLVTTNELGRPWDIPVFGMLIPFLSIGGWTSFFYIGLRELTAPALLDDRGRGAPGGVGLPAVKLLLVLIDLEALD